LPAGKGDGVLPEGKKAPIEATELKMYLLVHPIVIPVGKEVVKLFFKNIAGLFPLALAPQPPCVCVLNPGQLLVDVLTVAFDLNVEIKKMDAIKVQHLKALSCNIFFGFCFWMVFCLRFRDGIDEE